MRYVPMGILRVIHILLPLLQLSPSSYGRRKDFITDLHSFLFKLIFIIQHLASLNAIVQQIPGDLVIHGSSAGDTAVLG